ncbi:putative topoisomerase 1-associated factor 1 [Triangularia verruculosa]|uniref:Topoisomerase 1-associated factor 1 n=1 Tax=Triangularia verruculosa TaxID=2587418 RepID=A0AAN6XK78_9PEZI|nr:putative topoisomerase 1-associated factor 1 [Triangularia verruculosa]
MEDNEIPNDTVHPEVRAHINSLVSALGGFSVDSDDDKYKLGDDALEVLRDLKKWIRFYDEKTNRMDVARCLAEANIVCTDLLQILALWPPSDNDSKYRSKIALACYELMVPLTWPIEKDPETMTVNHHRHLPVLQLAQLNYKRAIINFDAAQILNTAIRVALPSMALPIGDRTARDQGIIKLILYFLRNIAMISPPPGVNYEGDESQISRSALIDAFSFQDVFLTILTIASNMGEDFRTEDVIILEILFHLLKRVDSSKLFVSEKQLNKIKTDELTEAMNKEAAMLRSYNKKAPTRHSRFGTMIWVKRESGRTVTVSGQDALLDPAARERKMDSTKTFKAPRRARKDEADKELGPLVNLDERARQQLKEFVSDFLDSGFNPLFLHLQRSIDREAGHVLESHKAQFFYLVSWFLEAERVRQQANKDQKKPSQPASADEVNSFNLVAAVLQPEMIITLNRYLDRSYTDKNWPLLTTVMRCYTQILLTIQEMTDSGNEEDEEIADNLLSNLFYEQTTHDAIANIARTYKDQGFEYLDACTELTHTFLRILEAYSKQNVDMQVRSRRRTRKKKKAKQAEVAANAGSGDEDEDLVNPVSDDDDEADARKAEHTTQERKFNFAQFATRFLPQGVVDTFVKFTHFYLDLSPEQLKRAHRYFYRVAFKHEMSPMLFRLDIVSLLYNMIKGPHPLDPSTVGKSVFKEWEELVKQIIRKCTKKLEERPALFVELLFSKEKQTAFYLEYGYEKQTSSSTNPRPGAELEFKDKMLEKAAQIAIVVGVLLDRNQTEWLEWVKKTLQETESERRAWEAAEQAKQMESTGGVGLLPEAPYTVIHPSNDKCRTAMFKNPHLRLLMKLVGFERLAPTLDETPDSVWIVPGRLSAYDLKENLDMINKAEFEPPTFEAGELAEDQLRRKSAATKAAPRKRAAFDDDDDDLLDDGEEPLFPVGGPTARKPDGERPKKLRRKRTTINSDGEEVEEVREIDDEEAAERAKARKQKQLEKLRKIKSEMYVRASDDESDEEADREFFAKEEERRQKTKAAFGEPTREKEKPLGVEKSAWERLLDGDDDEDEDDVVVEKLMPKPKKAAANRGSKRKSDVADLGSDEDVDMDRDDDEEENTADDESEESSTPPPAKRTAKKRKPSKKVVDEDGDEEMASATQTSDRTVGEKDDGVDEDDDDEDLPVSAPVRRPRVRAGFIMDSSDDE